VEWALSANTRFGAPLLVGIATAFAQSLTVEPWLHFVFTHVAWFPGAVLMCCLLLVPTARWPACIAGAILGSALFCVGIGRPLLPHCVVLLGEFLLVAGATYLLRTPARLRDGVDIGRLLLVAGMALPLVGGAWARTATHQFGMADMPDQWSQVVLARSIGYLILVPCFIGGVQSARRPWQGRQAPWTDVALGVVLLGALAIAWSSRWADSNTAPLLLIAPTAFLIWALQAFGVAGAFVAWLLVFAMALAQSSLGQGPLVRGDFDATVARTQLWALGTTGVLLTLAALTEQRRASHASLQDAYLRLSDLARKMMVVQESERVRIARELHDDISQSLACVSIEMSALKRSVEGEDRARVDDMQEHLRGVSEDVRRLSHDLHPSMLRYTSLAASLSALCESRTSPGGLQVRCEVDDTPALSNDQKLNLFRIAQEGIHNVEKHAHAAQARISLTRDDDDLVLRIDDDGVGLSSRASVERESPGLGMISIGERARLLQGHFTLRARRDGGTRLEVRCPLQPVSGG
jgi:signal transduction histidine kinase